MAASIRKQLADQLAPHLPGAKFVPVSRSLDSISDPVVMISLRELDRLPEAPIGCHQARFVVTVITPLKTPQRAEDDLDTLVADLVTGIDSIDSLRWESATKVVYNDSHLAYDVTVYAVTEKN